MDTLPIPTGDSLLQRWLDMVHTTKHNNLQHNYEHERTSTKQVLPSDGDHLPTGKPKPMVHLEHNGHKRSIPNMARHTGPTSQRTNAGLGNINK